MRRIRRAAERGVTRLDWLEGRHSFSFGGFHDPEWMGFRSLRVINDDRVEPSGGFGTHPHRDMEILTWVLEGAVQHRDSMGNSGLVRAGELQRMSAGTGVTHSELNPSDDELLHLLQIWILPEREGLAPGYEQAAFRPAERPGEWLLLASRDGRDGSLRVHQDVALHAALLPDGRDLRYAPAPGRHAYLQVARGSVTVDGERLEEGGGLAVSDEAELRLSGEPGEAPAEVLLFDLA